MEGKATPTSASPKMTDVQLHEHLKSHARGALGVQRVSQRTVQRGLRHSRPGKLESIRTGTTIVEHIKTPNAGSRPFGLCRSASHPARPAMVNTGTYATKKANVGDEPPARGERSARRRAHSGGLRGKRQLSAVVSSRSRSAAVSTISNPGCARGRRRHPVTPTMDRLAFVTWPKHDSRRRCAAFTGAQWNWSPRRGGGCLHPGGVRLAPHGQRNHLHAANADSRDADTHRVRERARLAGCRARLPPIGSRQPQPRTRIGGVPIGPRALQAYRGHRRVFRAGRSWLSQRPTTRRRRRRTPTPTRRPSHVSTRLGRDQWRRRVGWRRRRRDAPSGFVAAREHAPHFHWNARRTRRSSAPVGSRYDARPRRRRRW